MEHGAATRPPQISNACGSQRRTPCWLDINRNLVQSPAFLFDIGNVLAHFDFAPAIQRFAELSDATSDEVLARLTTPKDDLESGQMSDEVFIRKSIAL